MENETLISSTQKTHNVSRRLLFQAPVFLFRSSLGNVCHSLEFEAAVKLRSDVIDYTANLLEVRGSLIQLFEFQRTEVMSFGVFITENEWRSLVRSEN